MSAPSDNTKQQQPPSQDPRAGNQKSNASQGAQKKTAAWRDRATALLTSSRGKRVAMDQKTLKAMADKRGELLTARLEAARSGRTIYPSSSIKQFEFELQAIVAGNWAPGIVRPKNKEFDKMFYQANSLGSIDAGQVDDGAKVDAILTGD